jgi:hypothetical protein
LTEPLYSEQVESYCSVRRVVVGLVLQTDRRFSGDVVVGVPVSCSLSLGCPMGPRCILWAQRIETSRRKLRCR